jgi:hypothetical protein
LVHTEESTMGDMSEAGKTLDQHERSKPETSSKKPGPIADPVPQHTSKTGQNASEAAGRTASAAADVACGTADQGQEAFAVGLRAMADIQAPFAEASFRQSRRMADTAARVSEVYLETTDRTSNDMQAFAASFANLGRGFQQWRQAYLVLLQQSMERRAGKQRAFLRVNSPVELAEFQRDLYRDGVSEVFTASTTLFQLAGRIAEDAVRPLQERAEANTHA